MAGNTEAKYCYVLSSFPSQLFIIVPTINKYILWNIQVHDDTVAFEIDLASLEDIQMDLIHQCN